MIARFHRHWSLLAVLLAAAVCLLTVPSVSRRVQWTMGGVTAPIQQRVSGALGWVSEVWSTLTATGSRVRELEKQVTDLRRDLTELDRLRRENQWYRDFLSVKTTHPTFAYTAAQVMTTDAAVTVMTLSAGERDGIAAGDTVLAEDGLVGIVTEVGGNWCRVKTVLNEAVHVSVSIGQNGDSGLTVGSLPLAAVNRFQLTLLPKESEAGAGDRLVTSGIGGVFPAGLAVGAIETTALSADGVTREAEVRAAVTMSKLSAVLVVTDREGTTP